MAVRTLVALAALAAACGLRAAPEPPAVATVAPAARTAVTTPARTASPPPPALAVPGTPAATAAATPALSSRLAAAVGALAPAAGGTVHLMVIDDGGNEIFAHGATDAVLPASLQKLVTAAAALVVLGPDFRYRTTVDASAPLGPDGILAGDLVIRGSGDPALATPLFGTAVEPRRPRTPLEGLADQLVARGLRELRGGVLGDPTVFADEPLAPGWKASYLDDLDAVRVSGLTSDAGRKLEHRGSRLVGTAAPDPAAETAASLLVLLRERGVTVSGGPASTLLPPPPAPGATALAAVESPPLRDLLAHAVQRSDNHLADAIFRTVGQATGEPTWQGAQRAARRALSPLALDWTGVSLADGSGLSRDNRLTASFLAELVRQVRASRHAGTWDALLAVTAESGTLRRRLTGTAAAHRVRGKTGSLTDVRALAGSVVGPPGAGAYHFTVLVGLAPGGGRDAARALLDEVALALAEDLYGCVVQEPPAPAPDQPPPRVVRCRH